MPRYEPCHCECQTSFQLTEVPLLLDWLLCQQVDLDMDNTF